jgi:methionyl-tRNA formyltransferase
VSAVAARPLRVHFITENDPVYVSSFFETFFAEYPRSEVAIGGITVQRAFDESRRATARRVLALYGRIGFVRLGLRVAWRTATRRTVTSLAARQRIPLVSTRSVNDPAFVRRLRELGTDVVVSVAAPEIFRRSLLTTPPLGCINVHSGRLPVYRGMLPSFWQMRAGEPNVTVTVHEMVADLDAGAVLATDEVALRERDSLHRVMRDGKRVAARLVIRVLRQLADGSASPQPLDMSEASYFSFPSRSDRAAFAARGHRLL